MNRINPRVLALLVMLALWPAQGRAEFTDLEAASLRSAFNALDYAGTTEWYVAYAIRFPGTVTDANRAALEEVFRLLVSGTRDQTTALAILVGANPVQSGDTVNFQAWEQTPRADQVATAFWYLDRALGAYAAAANSITRAQAYNTTNAEYQDGLRRARDIWLAQAQSGLGGIDRSLAYANPYPPLCTGCTVITVVGPHGDYKRMQHLVYFATKYFRDWADNAAMMLGSDRLLADYGNWAAGFRYYTDGLRAQQHAMALLAGISFTAVEMSEDGFCRTLRVQQLLSVEAPNRYHQVQDVWRFLVDSAGGRPTFRTNLKASFTRLSDSWKHNDAAIWEGLRFPNSARCAIQ